MKASACRTALVSAFLVGCRDANTAASNFFDFIVVLLVAVVAWFVLLLALFAVLVAQRVEQRPSRVWGIAGAVVGAISFALATSWIRADVLSGLAAMLGSGPRPARDLERAHGFAIADDDVDPAVASACDVGTTFLLRGVAVALSAKCADE